MTKAVVDAEWIFAEPGRAPPVRGASIRIDGTQIVSVDRPTDERQGKGLAILPALANAHDHGRGLRPAAYGSSDQPLEAWVANLRQVPGVDLYTSTAVAFARMALSGIASISQVHIPGGGDTVEEARIVARAARDVGVRVGYALPVVDANAFVYGGADVFCACHSPDDWAIIKDWDGRPISAVEQMEAMSEVVRQCESATFSVQYGPAGPQWVTEAGLVHLAERSATENRRIHMHLLESPVQRAWSDKHYPDGLLNWLDSIGLLSSRLTLAHCVWLSDSEIALLAERDATAVINTSSNLRLRSGIAPAGRFSAAGLRFGFGLDGLAFNDDEDALFELRLLNSLHRPTGFSGEGLDVAQVWQAATQSGRFTIDDTRGAGTLAPGADADFMVVDYDALVGEGIAELCDPLELIMTRASRRHVRDLYVAGHQVVADGKLTGIDLEAAEAELYAAAHAASGRPLAEKQLMARNLDAVRRHYVTGGHLKQRD